MKHADVVIVGGGAAGLFCALTAGGRGRKVLVLEGANRIGKKILMSGGGRCNFTHLHSTHTNFLSANPHFCKSALARYTPYHFVELVDQHNIAHHEKTPGQLFCDQSSKQIVAMLQAECDNAGVAIHTHVKIDSIEHGPEGFTVHTEQADYRSDALVMASGGLSIPKMGASGFGYQIARQFGHAVLPTRAGLVPYTFSGMLHDMMRSLRGVAIPASVAAGGTTFSDGLLFTHRGLSGPAALQSSSYWQEGQNIDVNLLPDGPVYDDLIEQKKQSPRRGLVTALARRLPRSVATALVQHHLPDNESAALGELTHGALGDLASSLHAWSLRPSGTEGYRTAEVTLGGVDTDQLDSRTMMSRQHSGLFFIGEVVDVTGHLGGHNFQWAWASGHAAAASI